MIRFHGGVMMILTPEALNRATQQASRRRKRDDGVCF